MFFRRASLITHYLGLVGFLSLGVGLIKFSIFIKDSQGREQIMVPFFKLNFCSICSGVGSLSIGLLFLFDPILVCW